MPSWTIASIRAWPKAPRDCLLASTSRSVVTCEVRSVRFLCALSMMPSRSCSTRRLSMVLRVVASIDWPTRWVTESSRSLTARAISAWRPASACAHRIDPAGGLALRPQHLAEALLQLVGADRLRHRQFRAAAAGAGDDDGDRPAAAPARARRSRSAHRRSRIGRSPTMKRISFMPPCSRFGRLSRTKREHLWLMAVNFRG